MKKIYIHALCTGLLIAASLGVANAQNTVSGTVTDSDNLPLPGASIIEKGTTNGTTTDFDGKYSLTVGREATLRISFVGYQTAEVAVAGRSVVDVSLESEELEEVIIVGSRSAPRSNTDTPLPVDVLSAKELTATGQLTFDKALQYKIPSFNTVQTPVNDATSLLDPYEIRNMGPSRTLILINGKRKNLSSLLYVQTSPGRGETGADLSAIPADAIKRVEVLRDGASAQYGSDAIAGVINVILKDDARPGAVTLRTGITAEGDGESIGLSFNNGSPLGKGKGFINYTVDFSKINEARRSSDVSLAAEYMDTKTDIDSYESYLDQLGVEQGPNETNKQFESRAQQAFSNYQQTPDYQTHRAQIDTANRAILAEARDFLGDYPDALNRNSSPAYTNMKFLVNGGIDLTSRLNLYFNAAYVYKSVNSFANYRAPYRRPLSKFPYLERFFPGPQGSYIGYQPTFDGDLHDYNGTVGFSGTSDAWNYDVSLTVGGNRQTYRVRNTHNGNKVPTPPTWVDANEDGIVDNSELSSFQTYRENSPISFNPGGSQFNHVVGNIDINRPISERVGIGFGAEIRSETFTIIEGRRPSYEGGGPDSFAGNRPEDSGEFSRYNFGGYVDVAWDIFDSWLVNGTARIENYSDFGDAFVWKVSSRYKFWRDRMTLRASYSTGFRAPTLHQIYTQKPQYSFVAGEGIQVSGIFNNVSPQARVLEVPRLKAETSQNLTVGIGGSFFDSKLDFTVDYYNIAVDDRIVLGTRVKKDEDNPNAITINQILDDNNLKDLSFFSNAIDTRTQGIDVVVSYSDISVGKGTIGVNLSGNYTMQNEQRGDVKNPRVVAEAGQSIVDQTQSALFFTSRPQTKWILGIDYSVGRFDIALNNTLFGKSTFRQNGITEDFGLKTEFKPRVVTDLSVTYRPIDKIIIGLNINNLANVLPEWELVADNQDGQDLLDDTDSNYATGDDKGFYPVKTGSNNELNEAAEGLGRTKTQIVSDLITFSGRYSQMTYDGYHFSQLGALFNLSVSYRF